MIYSLRCNFRATSATASAQTSLTWRCDNCPSRSSGTILVCENGAGVDFSEEQAKKILLEHEIEILIDLKSGEASSTAWGCDLTYDYVKINGDYRT